MARPFRFARSAAVATALFTLVGFGSLPARGQDAADEAKPNADQPVAENVPAGKAVKTGSFQIKVPERCAESAVPALVARIGWSMAVVKDSGWEQDYDLANETFEVYVPPTYTGKEPYGLMVFVNAGNTGGPPNNWIPVLNKHHLLWVGANNSGNKRSGWIRLGLALDAAKYMPTAYDIDPDRVYVTGGSGGGRCSSMLGLAWPEFFTGGSYPMIGCNFYRRVEVAPAGAGKGAEFYEKSFKRPMGKLWDVVRNERRHVYLTGDNDANRLQTELNYKAAKKDGFKHITYIQVPGMGHQAPDAEWFEKGIIALDEGAHAVAGAGGGAGQKAAAKGEAAPAPKVSPQRVSRAPVKANAEVAAEEAKPLTPEEKAEKLMKLAHLYLDNRMYNRAREKLNLVVKDYPKTPQAREAQKLLREIGKG